MIYSIKGYPKTIQTDKIELVLNLLIKNTGMTLYFLSLIKIKKALPKGPFLSFVDLGKAFLEIQKFF
jgi:hypothetical protein